MQRAPEDDAAAMEKLAEFLRDVSSAWRNADQERRNKLARVLFDGVWIKDQSVLGVTPRPELKLFFDLQYAGLSNDVLQWRPRPESSPPGVRFVDSTRLAASTGSSSPNSGRNDGFG